MRGLKGRIMMLEKHSEFLLSEPMIYFGTNQAADIEFDEIEHLTDYRFDWPFSSFSQPIPQNAGLFFDLYATPSVRISGENL